MGEIKLNVQVSQLNSPSKAKIDNRDELKEQIEENDVINEFQRNTLLTELASGGPPNVTRATFEEAQKLANPFFKDEDEMQRQALLTGRTPRLMV
jgi:hypothetical protein